MQEIISAASFHGNIGQGKRTLDKMAASEQVRARALYIPSGYIASVRPGCMTRKPSGFQHMNNIWCCQHGTRSHRC